MHAKKNNNMKVLDINTFLDLHKWHNADLFATVRDVDISG